MKPTLETIIKASGLHPSRVFNVYIFGSQVYGTANKDSDWDIIMVANNSVESTELRKGLFNIHVYTPDKFKAAVLAKYSAVCSLFEKIFPSIAEASGT